MINRAGVRDWRQACLSRGFVDYHENGEQTHRVQTHRGGYRIRPGPKNVSIWKSMQILLYVTALKPFQFFNKLICKEKQYWIKKLLKRDMHLACRTL